MPSCALDDAGRREQSARYARLAATVACLDRAPEEIVIEFGEDLDRETLEQTLAIERKCCPFFLFEYDEATRRLLISVREPEQLPALRAIADAFGALEQASADGKE